MRLQHFSRRNGYVGDAKADAVEVSFGLEVIAFERNGLNYRRLFHERNELAPGALPEHGEACRFSSFKSEFDQRRAGNATRRGKGWPCLQQLFAEGVEQFSNRVSVRLFGSASLHRYTCRLR